MIDKAIMKELRETTGKSTPSLYRMIKSKQVQHGNLITVDEAAVVLAGELGIDVSRMVPTDELHRVRTAVSKAPRTGAISVETSRREEVSGVVIDVSKGLRFEEPILPKALAKEAERMSEVYPIIYVFENSVRNLIKHVLGEEHGSGWWEKAVSFEIRKKVKIRKGQEKRKRWHGRRGSHEVFYTDMDDLRRIITTNWRDFEPVVEEKLSWVKTCLNTIESSRNVVAHNNPLTVKDIERIKMFFGDWTRQIKDLSGREEEIA